MGMGSSYAARRDQRLCTWVDREVHLLRWIEDFDQPEHAGRDGGIGEECGCLGTLCRSQKAKKKKTKVQVKAKAGSIIVLCITKSEKVDTAAKHKTFKLISQK